MVFLRSESEAKAMADRGVGDVIVPSGRTRVAFSAQGMIGPAYGIARYVRNLLNAMAQLEEKPDLTVFYAGRRRLRDFEHVWPHRWIRMPTRALAATSVAGPVPIELFIGRHQLVHGPDVIGVRSVAPQVITLHDLTFFRLPELFPSLYDPRRNPALGVYQQRARASILRASHIICVSQATRKDLLELFDVDPNRVSVVPHGSPELPAGYRREPNENGHVRILFVGMLVHRKNLPTAVDAVSLLRRGGIDAELVVCGDGDGPESAAIRADCERRAGDRWLTWRGRVTDDLVWSELARATALIYPSWYEGFGLPPFEAFQAAVPVVAAKSSSLSELLQGAALLCDPGSPEEFAAALGRIVSNRSERDRLVRNGRDRAAQYTWRRAAEETVAVYERFG